MERHCFRVLSDYYFLLRRWKDEYAPRQPGEAPHPRFIEALMNISRLEYLLDMLLFGDVWERPALTADCGNEVRKIEKRMARLTAGDMEENKGHVRKHKTFQ